MKLTSYLTPLVLLPTLLSAAVNPGVSTSDVSLSYVSSVGSLSTSGTKTATGTTIANVTETVVLSDSSPDGSLESTFALNVICADSVWSPSSSFLQVIGGSRTDNTVIHDFTWTPNPAAPVIATCSAELLCTYTFTIADAPMDAVVVGSLTVGSPGYFILQYQHPTNGWQEVFNADPDTHPENIDQDGGFQFSQPLAVGQYRILTALDSPNTLTGREAISFSLTVGAPPVPNILTPSGDHTHPLVGTLLDDSPKLIPLNPSIVSETSLNNGFTEVVVTVNLQNTSDCPWNETTVTIPEIVVGQPNITLIDGGTPPTDLVLRFNDIPAVGVATPFDLNDQLTFHVADADLATVRSSILNGTRFSTHGRELWVFTFPVDLITPERAEQLLAAWNPFTGSTSFDTALDFQVGTILLEYEDLYAFQLIRETPLDEGGLFNSGYGGRYRQGIDAALHFPMLIGEVNPLPGGGVTILPYDLSLPSLGVTKPYNLLNLVKHGTIKTHSDTTNPSGPGINTGIEGDPITVDHPVHFNRVNIADKSTSPAPSTSRPDTLTRSLK